MIRENTYVRRVSKCGLSICKDNNGGFGTGNDLGDTFVSKILKSYLKKSIDFPPLSFVSSMGQLRKNGYDIVCSKYYMNILTFVY